VTGARWELLRALGAVADGPADAGTAAAALGLGAASAAEHTEVFVLNCPPSASVYLGPDGTLGGEGADRAAGFWRAIGLTPPTEPDHLTALLSLYASLGEAAGETRRAATAAALARSQAALFWEHLWSWMPGYLDAIADVGVPALTAWAQLTWHAIAAEYGTQPTPARLPLALRAAPAAAGPDGPLRDLVAALTTPVRSGIILTRHRLAVGAGQAGVGHRIGERRYTLRAMLEQDPPATLTWLGEEAQRWERRHASRADGDTASRADGDTASRADGDAASRADGDAASRWWTVRAACTARFLRASAADARTRASESADHPGDGRHRWGAEP
jgi:TorA maturation chaperone TorD